MNQLGIRSLAFVAVGGLVYALSKALRIRQRPFALANAREAGTWGIAATLAGWALVSALILLAASSQGAPQGMPDKREYGAGDVVGQAILALLAVGPALAVLRWRREPWASAGVSAHNLGRSLLVGLVLALLLVGWTVFASPHDPREVVAGLTVSHFWALLQWAIVGFGEEFLFRGVLQTRLAAWLGRWQGWVIASAWMALAHVVQRVAMEGLSPAEALLSSVSLIPISLLLGYVMLCTGNVAAPALFHTFVNWVNTLG